MRRILTGLLVTVVCAVPSLAQRTPSSSAVRAEMEEFVLTVRDMARWALITPAAHVPVGGILDGRGEVESVVGDSRATMFTPDSILTPFRRALGVAGRRRRSNAIAVAYFIRQPSRASERDVEAIIVEAEHRSGYRTNVMYRYTMDEAGEPVFSAPIRSAGTLRELNSRRSVVEAPDDIPPRPPRDTVVRPPLEETARRIVRAVPYPTFITNDSAGRPQARTVQPVLPDASWAVWFATNPRTRKVGEIERDPRVVLHYFDQGTLSYVALHGRARVVRDRATKAAHWVKEWDAFYPDRDASVVLIAVDAERLEIVSSTLGVSGDAATWRPPTVTLPPRRTPRR